MIALMVNQRARWRCFGPLASSYQFQMGRNALKKSVTSQKKTSKLSIEDLLRFRLLLW